MSKCFRFLQKGRYPRCFMVWTLVIGKVCIPSFTTGSVLALALHFIDLKSNALDHSPNSNISQKKIICARSSKTLFLSDLLPLQLTKCYIGQGGHKAVTLCPDFPLFPICPALFASSHCDSFWIIHQLLFLFPNGAVNSWQLINQLF